ncbi:ras and Rab interactor 3-like [Archocentrus centrarchus]|uniref:ras and Rab interactor 3-like n=1 Tax=Archocentrus centrarchus TaxID=63155 RepID=UPI0011EA2071|nr:ras and Rab interactor 3-like [Archocentrus centrarchus]XP_030601558.1 ras and Rab interactor 3-like [Archocentrus centrarchus]
MAQQEEPLYDFPEPTQPSERKLLHQRGQGSLKNISVLDRLLLTVPVWLQLSINPATALHILQREPPGTFLVRKSRTSQRNVLCVRLTDDSVPSFVQQFGIREEQGTLSLETSAISFPDVPKLISFYCVSRDVLPFPLELPEAIAKATSHKELESISHMGIEFWSSHLNVRGPREIPKPRKAEEKQPDVATSALPMSAPQTSSAAPSDSAPQSDSDNQFKSAPESDAAAQKPALRPTLFHEFCPITTRSPSELDCGSGLGALCFINPLFLQSQSTFSRRHIFKHSHKVRVSTETSTMLSPPIDPPPPPPLIPKSKGRCKAQKGGQETLQLSEGQAAQIYPPAKDAQPRPVMQNNPSDAQVQPPSAPPHIQLEMQEQQMEAGQSKGVKEEEAAAQHLPEDSDYMKPSAMISFSNCASLSPYMSPSVSPMPPALLPKMSPSLFLHDSPGVSPSLSPYHSPSLSPKVSTSLSPNDSPNLSPSHSPYHSPSLSPKVPYSHSPFTSQHSPLIEQASDTCSTPSTPDKLRTDGEAEKKEGAEMNENIDKNGETKDLYKKREEEENDLVLQMNAATVNDTESCSSFSSLEETAETQPHPLDKQADGTSI